MKRIDGYFRALVDAPLERDRTDSIEQMDRVDQMDRVEVAKVRGWGNE